MRAARLGMRHVPGATSFRVLDSVGAVSPHFGLFTPDSVPIPEAREARKRR